MSEDRQLHVSWEEFHQTVKALALTIKDIKPWKGIVAVTRGGLVPASILARELDVRLIDTLCISSYCDKENSQHTHEILKDLSFSGDDWLVVDDLVDTGATMRLLRQRLPKAYYATVYAKPAGQAAVDTFVEPLSQETWIVFPWEE